MTGSRWRDGGGEAAARSRHALGRAGEAAAETYLRDRGFTILARNYRCAAGEVDLVAIDAGTLVFVEVKTRAGTACGMPLDAVDQRKQRRLAAVARHFLQQAPRGLRALRFDVVGVLWRAGTPEIEHLTNAFDLG